MGLIATPEVSILDLVRYVQALLTRHMAAAAEMVVFVLQAISVLQLFMAVVAVAALRVPVQIIQVVLQFLAALGEPEELAPAPRQALLERSLEEEAAAGLPVTAVPAARGNAA
jgi:hypothetical protein